MKARHLFALLAAGSLAACGRSPTRLETRTFALHYMNRGEAQQLVAPYVYSDRPGAAGASTRGENTLTAGALQTTWIRSRGSWRSSIVPLQVCV